MEEQKIINLVNYEIGKYLEIKMIAKRFEDSGFERELIDLLARLKQSEQKSLTKGK